MEAAIGQSKNIQLVVFSLDGVHYGLSLSSVIRVLRAVEITPLPKTPRIVTGVINLAGRIIPVMNLRGRFGLPERDLRLSDQLIIATTSGGATPGSGRILALIVDGVEGVVDCAVGETLAEAIVPGLEHLHGVAKSNEGLILIHDLATFLSLDEEAALTRALERGTA